MDCVRQGFDLQFYGEWGAHFDAVEILWRGQHTDYTQSGTPLRGGIKMAWIRESLTNLASNGRVDKRMGLGLRTEMMTRTRYMPPSPPFANKCPSESGLGVPAQPWRGPVVAGNKPIRGGGLGMKPPPHPRDDSQR